MAGAFKGWIGQIMSGSRDTSIGLSIGTSAIKLVELKRTGKSWKLLHFGIVQLPEDTILDHEITNPVAVVESIRTLVNQIQLKSKSVCSSLYGSAVIIKRLSVEVKSMKDLRDAVFFEAEQYLPFDAADVVMDYQVLSKGKDKRVDVLLVAAKKGTLDAYMGCIEDAGLKPKFIDVDYLAMQNFFEINYPIGSSEAAAIVDLGASSLKLLVMQNGVPVFTKDSAMGGKNLTTEIQKHLNLSYGDAESLKVGGQAAGMPQEVSDLMNIMAESLAMEIKRGLDFYHSSTPGAHISYILLTGGCSRIPEISRIVEETTGFPTQIANPFGAISTDPEVFTQDYLTAIGPVAAVPIGLALRAGAE